MCCCSMAIRKLLLVMPMVDLRLCRCTNTLNKIELLLQEELKYLISIEKRMADILTESMKFFDKADRPTCEATAKRN